MKIITLRIERTENTTKLMAAWLALSLCAGLLAGCASGKPAKPTDRQIYDAVKLGMSRTEVVRLAGPTYMTAGDYVYYGGAPAVESWRRQLTPATVSILFSTNNVVVKKVFNDGKQMLTEESTYKD